MSWCFGGFCASRSRHVGRYLVLLPHAIGAPMSTTKCPKCGSTRIERKGHAESVGTVAGPVALGAAAIWAGAETGAVAGATVGVAFGGLGAIPGAVGGAVVGGATAAIAAALLAAKGGAELGGYVDKKVLKNVICHDCNHHFKESRQTLTVRICRNHRLSRVPGKRSPPQPGLADILPTPVGPYRCCDVQRQRRR